jgi:hypothetical protein
MGKLKILMYIFGIQNPRLMSNTISTSIHPSCGLEKLGEGIECQNVQENYCSQQCPLALSIFLLKCLVTSSSMQLTPPQQMKE